MDWKFKYNLFDLFMFEIAFLEAENFSLSKCVSNQIQYKDKKINNAVFKKKTLLRINFPAKEAPDLDLEKKYFGIPHQIV